MYKHKWAAIIYGRSFHLDFRFITIPQDFDNQEKDWASQYILATFSHANKLSSHPRWSLFKNESHCVVGVTCMVRDLLIDLEPDLIELLSKDNRGRPLYVFIGYVTQLDRRKCLFDFPPYTDKYLKSFQHLYQYILEVWWVEEYQKDSKKPIFNQYQLLDFAHEKVQLHETFELAKQINHQKKYPHQTYLWHNTLEQKRKLWIASAVSHQTTSVCLGDQATRNIVNSPFLNQTAICESSEEIVEGCAMKKITNQTSLTECPSSTSENLSQIITNKVKEDIEVTLQHAKIVKNKSRDLLQNIGDRGKQKKTISSDRSISKLSLSQTPTNKNKAESKANFGLKVKSKSQSDLNGEWF